MLFKGLSHNLFRGHTILSICEYGEMDIFLRKILGLDWEKQYFITNQCPCMYLCIAIKGKYWLINQVLINPVN